MSNDRSDELQDHHDDGQSDGASGEYHQPHSITPLDEVVQSDRLLDEMREDNKAYDKGYEHGRKQS
jgi:hypothetical protein